MPKKWGEKYREKQRNPVTLQIKLARKQPAKKKVRQRKNKISKFSQVSTPIDMWYDYDS